MSSITDAQKAMGPIYMAWTRKKESRAKNQKRYEDARKANIGGGWSPCNFKWANNEWPSRCGVPIEKVDA